MSLNNNLWRKTYQKVSPMYFDKSLYTMIAFNDKMETSFKRGVR